MGKKILHLIDSGGLYGAEILILNLVQAQLKTGGRPMLLSVGAMGDADKPIEVEAKKRGLPYKKWRMKSGINIAGANEIVRWSNSAGYDILHSHGYKFNILLSLSRLTGHHFSSVATVHGYTNSDFLSKLWFYKHLDGFALKMHDRVCVVSSNMLKIPSIASINSQKVSVVENGIDVEAGRDQGANLDSSLKSFLDNNDFTFLAIGRLSKEKNFIGLIDAMSLLAQRHSRVGLVIVGDGIQREALERRIEQVGVNSKVKLLGYKADASSLMKYFSALVISSHSEGLPICLLEAMREGLPVVATPVGGIPDVLQKGRLGMLARSSEANAIFEALVGTLTNKDILYRKAILARDVFLEKYTISRMSKKYDDIYKSIFL